MTPKVSVIINTKNAAQTVKATLESVKWADEIVVVDMLSSDKTKTITKKYTSKIYDFKEKADCADPARNFAFSKATNKWLLMVDADEVIPTSLKDKLLTIVANDPETACFYIARKNIIFGKWIEKTGWWPDYQPRLFQKGKLVWQDGVHSQPKISGQVEYLPASENLAIEHYNYKSVSDYITRLDRYTSIAADESDFDQVAPTDIIDTFKQELMRRLFAEQGIDEGIHGVSLSFLQSMYQVVVLLKQWEKEGSPASYQSTDEVVAAMEELQADLAYWIADYRQKQTTGVNKLGWRLRKKLKR